MKLKLSRNGQIYIPNCIRKELNLEVGHLISIILDGEIIVLTNKDEDENENKCIFSENGTVHIPTEIRRLSNIKSEAFFRLILDKKEKRINLIPEIKGL
ncbi:AbrB/MazE/SpoVT family DNA-binding domain-containing protein [Metabacillus litoralis]|jgi:AbrB family looped-hinge helix DNA binding protein|uniref:AbrB/MazE/SpoVT family DNA-binding domain-containing protein n=1 Tax=Metabacillus litoralis TaxID=152268 RepID=UPI00203F2810|nr:AbrB/MazE/SpoVT family DNA-binding domain-containing protein [Metabacillus litoralis]MCM3654180.1 AbrB/MazE/SpoVT family DNA-binding domain-containing protein [Metabacillus litoralis]